MTTITLLLARSLMFLLIISYGRGQFNPTRTKHCDIVWYKRKPCERGRNLKADLCAEQGCCYRADTRFFNVPVCYESNAPKPIRGIPLSTTPSAGNPIASASRSQTYERLGPFRFLRVCGSTTPCGGRRTTEEQCRRFRCCWDDNYSRPIQHRCFSVRWHWLNFPDKNAKWSQWSTWGACAGVPCGTGVQTRTRICSNYIKNRCRGPSTQQQQCMVPCPGAFWSAWVPAGPCVSPDPLCLAGKMRERRFCLGPNNQRIDSSNCPGGQGNTEQEAQCREHLCPSFTEYQFGPCSPSCGDAGFRTGVRTCTSLVLNLPVTCTQTVEQCTVNSCPKQPEWSNWSSWGSCIGMTCTSGVQTRTRMCNNMKYGSCQGDSSQQQDCTVTCPGANWSNWMPQGTCVSPEPACLVGTVRERRYCLNSNNQIVDSTYCQGGNANTERDAQCNEHLCPGFTNFIPGTCSATCGDGATRTLSRTCISNAPSLPSECLSRKEPCVLSPCPVMLFDIMLLVDSSNSVGPTQFNLAIEWLATLSRSIPVSNGVAQVGMIRYATVPRSQFLLGQHSTNDQVDNAIRSVQYTGGGGDVTAAVVKATTQDFTVPANRYPLARRIAILVHQGDILNVAPFLAAAVAAQNSGIEFFSISVQPQGNVLSLLSSVGFVLSSSSFEQLPLLTTPLVQAIFSSPSG
ncbi:uncharacterized protein LOC143452025 [Clavelina lepadiformis]|uniref:uncharacterized protein LOC143452025 n=1 Tax=Clavelina lepadiformis TaxID=159417 RepID=UPI0040415308